MLSYQHAYHAGNLADVHKHALLAQALAYLTQKPKPLIYAETHAGRGLYDLSGPEAVKTGEAAEGIVKVADWFETDHPYRRALDHIRTQHGPDAYPGSPAVAQALLRGDDTIVLAERHPQEFTALKAAFPRLKPRHEDGWTMAKGLIPPTPRRGLMLVDPSYETPEDYIKPVTLARSLQRKWPVGILMIWYPILTGGAERAMVKELTALPGKTALSEVWFPPARDGHRLIGSGLFVINPPWGWEDAANTLKTRFDAL